MNARDLDLVLRHLLDRWPDADAEQWRAALGRARLDAVLLVLDDLSDRDLPEPERVGVVCRTVGVLLRIGDSTWPPTSRACAAAAQAHARAALRPLRAQSRDWFKPDEPKETA